MYAYFISLIQSKYFKRNKNYFPHRPQYILLERIFLHAKQLSDIHLKTKLSNISALVEIRILNLNISLSVQLFLSLL